MKKTTTNNFSALPLKIENSKCYYGMDGIYFLNNIVINNSIRVCFFDPQYRGLLDKQKYGNEGKSRNKRACSLPQMSEQTIIDFINRIDKVLLPSAYLFLWIDKYHLLSGFQNWLNNTSLHIVDMIVWEKHKIGMGYRSRRKGEYCIIIQKPPIKAKQTWFIRNIPDVWKENVSTKDHPHCKPIKLQKALIEATTRDNDVVMDVAMGSGSVFKACQDLNITFLGCELLPFINNQT